MARIKPQALLIQSKKKKGPTRISLTTIITCNLVVMLIVLSLYGTYKHWHRRLAWSKLFIILNIWSLVISLYKLFSCCHVTFHYLQYICCIHEEIIILFTIFLLNFLIALWFVLNQLLRSWHTLLVGQAFNQKLAWTSLRYTPFSALCLNFIFWKFGQRYILS